MKPTQALCHMIPFYKIGKGKCIETERRTVVGRYGGGEVGVATCKDNRSSISLRGRHKNVLELARMVCKLVNITEKPQNNMIVRTKFYLNLKNRLGGVKSIC